MCARMLATGRYTEADFRGIRSIFEIDDKITAPSFGFRGAEHYYETQSSNQFLERIRVPTLVVQAQDDTFIPFEIFRRPEFSSNPHLELLAPERGGHLGFISRVEPRIWLDGVLDNRSRLKSKVTAEQKSPADAQNLIEGAKNPETPAGRFWKYTPCTA